jgi:hypothetical protein
MREVVRALLAGGFGKVWSILSVDHAAMLARRARGRQAEKFIPLNGGSVRWIGFQSFLMSPAGTAAATMSNTHPANS